MEENRIKLDKLRSIVRDYLPTEIRNSAEKLFDEIWASWSAHEVGGFKGKKSTKIECPHCGQIITV